MTTFFAGNKFGSQRFHGYTQKNLWKLLLNPQ